jgi:hypothetical protein
LAPVLLWLLRDCFSRNSKAAAGGKAIVAGLLAILFINIFWSKTFLDLLQNPWTVANDTTMAVLNVAGLLNGIACLAALIGVIWLQVKSPLANPAPCYRTLGSTR